MNFSAPTLLTRLSSTARAPLALLACALLAGLVQAQTQQTNTGTTGSGTSGSQFQAEEVDLSAFSGVERGEGVGSTTTQGFGIVGESTGTGTAGAAGGGGGGGGGFGGLGGLFGALGSAFGGQNASAQKPVIRVRLKSAIEMPPRPEAELQRSALRTLDSLPMTSGVRGVRVNMVGRTAVLRGTVASEKDRRMSELLMRLEPGVSQVDNQVVVAR